MTLIRIALADDHQLFREGLTTIIGADPRLEVILEASNGQELLDAMAEHTPDVVLLDLKMPVMDGMEAAELLRKDYPEVKVVILTMHHQEDFILHMLNTGVNAYLFKNASSQTVKEALVAVHERDYYFDDTISQVMLHGLRKKVIKKPTLSEDAGLTPREQEVLELIAKEYTNTEIADRLFVSIRTVETHRKNMLQKFGAKNTAGMIIKAIQQGLIEVGEV